MNDIEQQLRTTFAEIAAHDTPTPDLAERLIANALAGTNTVVPLRRSTRFTAPLLAAAVVLLLAAGILVATRFSASSPPVSPPPAPAPSGPSVSSTGSAPSSAPTSGSIAGGLSVPSWVTGTVSGSAGLPAGFTPGSTQFLDRTTGFLLGSGPCSTGSEQCGGLYRTGDGGATWTELSALATVAGGRGGGVMCPVGDSSANSCAKSVHFADARHGVVSGEFIALVTDDAGVTWRTITWAEQTARSVIQVGEDVYALDYDLANGKSQLLRANGNKFAALTSVGTPRTPRYVTGNAGRLFVVSTATTSGEDSLSSTADGINWRIEPAPPCASSAFQARADGTVVLICLTEPRGAVLAPDARSWTQFGGSPVADEGSNNVARVTSAADSRHFSVSVQRGDLDTGAPHVWGVTSDGGTTWKTLTSDSRFPSPDDTSRLLSENGGALTAVLTTERLLVTSTDLGLTWNARVLG